MVNPAVAGSITISTRSMIGMLMPEGPAADVRRTPPARPPGGDGGRRLGAPPGQGVGRESPEG